MIDLGIVHPGSTIRIPFSSFDKDDGSSITMTNYAAADILIYKDGGTTERASTSGYTATTDFDSKTGKQLAVITLSDNTTAGFFNAGSEYLVAIDAVTVDGVTTGGWIARFVIGYEDAIINTTIATLASATSFTLTAGPAEDDALNGMWCIIHDIASAVQLSWVLISDYTGSTKTVTLAAGATFTAAAGDNISIMFPSPLQATVMGRTLDVSTGGEAGVDWANVGSPTTTVGLSGTTVKTATDVETDTADIQTRIPAALVSGRIDASTGAMAANVLTATAINADAITAAKIADGAIDAATFASGALDAVWSVATRSLTTFGTLAADVWAVATRLLTAGTNIVLAKGTGVTGFNDLSAAQVNAEADTALADYDGPTNAEMVARTLVAAAYFDPAADSVIVGTNNDKTGYGLSSAAVQAIWDALTSALTTVGSIGKLLVDNINATISSRLASASITLSSGKVTVGTNDDKTDYAIGVGGIATTSFAAGAIDAAALAQSAGQEIADEVLNRNLAGGGSGNTRNVRNALRALRNKVDGSTGTLSVYEEDDTTPAWTAALTRTAGVDPIVTVDP